jgi:hypothetical protein
MKKYMEEWGKKERKERRKGKNEGGKGQREKGRGTIGEQRLTKDIQLLIRN